VRSVAADEENNRSSSSFLGGHRSFLFVCLAVVVLLGLEAQGSAWASPTMHGLRDTIPTMTPTRDPYATLTPHPSATPIATLAPWLRRTILQQGVSAYDGAGDTYLDFWWPVTGYGSADRLEVSSDGTEVALLRFGLSGLPAGIQVESAYVQIYALDWTESGAATAVVYRLLRRWETS